MILRLYRLTCLIEKYFEETQVLNPTKINCSKNPPLGRFCAYLSCCVAQYSLLTSREIEALNQLIHASILVNQISPEDEQKQPLLEQPCGGSRRYWAQRFFRFIRQLSELKASPRDEKSLFDFKPFA